jgi:histidyl-tRNA synthetase
MEQIGGPPTPAIGFGAGIERLMLALENEGVSFAAPELDVFVVVDGAEPFAAHGLLQELRRAGFAADMDFAGRSVKGQLTQGARTGAATLVVLGAGDATIRRAGTSDLTVGLDKVVATLKA